MGKLVKICGITDRRNLEILAALEPDFFGFIFYPGSPRYVSSEKMRELRRIGSAKRIGVFVNTDEQTIASSVREYDLDGIQLHGSESADFCARVREQCGGILIIKAIAAKPDLLEGAKEYEPSCDFLLFDTPTVAHGGSGLRFDASLLSNLTSPLPFLLSGGLDAGAVKDAAEALASCALCGFDFNSRLETSVGIKSETLARQAIQEVRSLNV